MILRAQKEANLLQGLLDNNPKLQDKPRKALQVAYEQALIHSTQELDGFLSRRYPKDRLHTFDQSFLDDWEEDPR